MKLPALLPLALLPGAGAFAPAAHRAFAAPATALRAAAAEAIEAALAASKEHGPTSPEARVLWDIVEEMDASDNRCVRPRGTRRATLFASPGACDETVVCVPVRIREGGQMAEEGWHSRDRAGWDDATRTWWPGQSIKTGVFPRAARLMQGFMCCSLVAAATAGCS